MLKHQFNVVPHLLCNGMGIKMRCTYIETSAQTGANVAKGFESLAKEVKDIKYPNQPPKPSITINPIIKITRKSLENPKPESRCCTSGFWSKIDIFLAGVVDSYFHFHSSQLSELSHIPHQKIDIIYFNTT